jgi:hypothetical protein
MTPDETQDYLRSLKGVVATTCLTGSVLEEYATCREEMRVRAVTSRFVNIEWRTFNGVLVEHARDEVCAHALSPNPQAAQPSYDWLLQIDADATFPPDALERILHTAYVKVPDADVVGAYSQLKSEPFLPTIDTGSGTWEPRFPGEGVLPVIRTGAHFLLVKTPILRRFGPPWFRTRRSVRPIDALREIDNFSRIRNDGANVLAGDAWDSLLAEAKRQGGGVESPVGEDSGFCDSVKAVGGNIYVDTDLVTGHIGKRNITPKMLSEKMREREAHVRAAMGIYE